LYVKCGQQDARKPCLATRHCTRYSANKSLFLWRRPSRYFRDVVRSIALIEQRRLRDWSADVDGVIRGCCCCCSPVVIVVVIVRHVWRRRRLLIRWRILRVHVFTTLATVTQSVSQFPAQHLRPSGVFSCRPDGLELTPGFYSGSNEQHRLYLGVYLKRTCSRVTSASSALGVLNDYALCKSTHSLTQSVSQSILFVSQLLNTER